MNHSFLLKRDKKKTQGCSPRLFLYISDYFFFAALAR